MVNHPARKAHRPATPTHRAPCSHGQQPAKDSSSANGTWTGPVSPTCRPTLTCPTPCRGQQPLRRKRTRTQDSATMQVQTSPLPSCQPATRSVRTAPNAHGPPQLRPQTASRERMVVKHQSQYQSCRVVTYVPPCLWTSTGACLLPVTCIIPTQPFTYPMQPRDRCLAKHLRVGGSLLTP